ncbi:MAG: TIGR00341 family protein [Balneolaceae bacterium]
MPLRQIDVVIPKEAQHEIDELLQDETIIHYWRDSGGEESDSCLMKVVLDVSKTEPFLDRAEQLMGRYPDFRMVIMSVDATIPRIEEPKKDEEEEPADKESPEPWERPLEGLRVSREELYTQISDGIKLNRIYLAMVVFSTIVAALGILRDNTAVVIGAMVIAPLLAPNIGLALSTTLGDLELGRKSLKSNVAGLAVALAISILLGMFMTVDESVYQIASRTEVHLSDISLALASGAAGVLAYTVGMSAAVIGVMVAVALLPPLVTAGLLFGSMQWDLAVLSFLLLITNVICVNLAAVATFILQGIRPRTWYETRRADQANRIALALWITLLIALAVIIYVTGSGTP